MQGQDWRQSFEQWKIKLVVIEENSPLAKLLRQEANWKETYHDSQASVFQWQEAGQ